MAHDQPNDGVTGAPGRMRAWGQNLALLGASLLLAALVGEGVTRIYYGFETGWKPRNPEPVLDGTVYQYDPLFGWRLIPNAHARLRGVEFDTEIDVNSQGLRMEHDVSSQRPPGKRRILLFGDSFTFGHGVEANERFGERLESMLEDVEVVNFGISASGTDQHYLLYRERGVQFEADLVVLCYLVNHIQRNVMDFISGRSKPKFLVVDGELQLTNVPVPRERAPSSDGHRTEPEPRGTGIAIPFKGFLREHSQLYAFLRARIGNTIHRLLKTNPDPFPEYRDDDPAWRVTDALLERFAEDVTRNGEEFLLVVLPVPEFVQMNHLSHRPFEMLTDAGVAHGFPVLDLTPGLRDAAAESSEKLYYRFDSHWTPTGHAAAAKIMAAYLVDRFEWLHLKAGNDHESTQAPLEAQTP